MTAFTQRGPRIFAIPAREAPVVAVLRRGPSDWWHIGRWWLEPMEYEPGAWFKGSLYPQKCDVSPNGKWLAYSALREPADWPAGSIYEAISRLPWLTALSAWEAGTTYTRGIHFDDEPHTCELGEPDVGDASSCLNLYGIKLNRAVQFAVERRRGWTETPDTPPREAGGPWDENRRVTMTKPQPGETGLSLMVEGAYAGFRSSPDQHGPPVYSLVGADGRIALDSLQWADWTPDGRLLTATNAGAIEAMAVDRTVGQVVWSHDLSDLTPDPQPAPPWASEW